MRPSALGRHIRHDALSRTWTSLYGCSKTTRIYSIHRIINGIYGGIGPISGTGTDVVGEVLGATWLDKGENTDVTVKSSRDLAPGEDVVLMIYDDEGDFARTFEPERDKPFEVADMVTVVILD